MILSAYLGSSGYDLTKALLEQRSWQTTGLFPRVTMCDFKVRVACANPKLSSSNHKMMPASLLQKSQHHQALEKP